MPFRSTSYAEMLKIGALAAAASPERKVSAKGHRLADALQYAAAEQWIRDAQAIAKVKLLAESKVAAEVKAAAEAMDTTVTAPKKAFPKTVAKVSLPGIFFKDLCMRLYKSLAAPDFEINSPIKTNKCITANT